jgi:hypothetical protein
MAGYDGCHNAPLIGVKGRRDAHVLAVVDAFPRAPLTVRRPSMPIH